MAKEFKVPEVGEGISSGTVVSVLVSEGDRIAVDQPVLELETDKAVVEVPSNVAGVVKEVKVKANQEAQVGQVVLVVEEAEAEGAATTDEAEEGSEAKAEQKAAPAAAASARAEAAEAAPQDESRVGEAPAGREAREEATKPAEGTGDGRIPAAPSVRRLAREKGVDLRAVKGSGILGRISSEDVLRHVEPEAPKAPAPKVELPDFSTWGEVERQAMSGIRKATVRTMATAWNTVPMVTHFDKADAGVFEELRRRYQVEAERAGTKLTPTAMLVKIVAAALARFPDFNASIDADKSEIIYKRYVNIGVAVDTDYGLLVPVIKHADSKGALELAQELGALAKKARERKLAPEEMQGGNFSVSNLGGIGGTGFTPIVNPPEVAILGVARAAFEPFYNQEEAKFEPKLMMPLALTYDHRLIDGAAAARFLRWICRAVEDPFLLAL